MKRFLSACAILIASAAAAPAAIIQLTAFGTVTSGTQTGPTGLVDLGAPARFDLVYDTSFPDQNPGDPTQGVFISAFVSATA